MMSSRRKSPLNTISTEPQYCSTDLRLKILSRLPFFAGLPPHAIQGINQHFVEIGYQPGERIYSAGDPAERLFVVAEGKVKLYQHALNGRSVLLDILTSGEFFGNLATLGVSEYVDAAQAQTASCVLSIRSDAFRQILNEHPELAMKALAVMSDRLNAANQRVLQLSAMSAEKRIAATLLKLGDKLGRRNELGCLIDVPLSRDDMAEMTGATTETVSRVMSQLQTSQIITSGRQWVAITNQEKLSALAGEE